MSFLTISFYSGIALLILCILVLATPLGKRFSSATQKIQGFGLNLEVSVLTLLVLISVGLMTSGIWIQLQDTANRLKQLEHDKAIAEEKAKQAAESLANANRVSIAYLVTLQGVDDISRLNIPSMSCKYVVGEVEKDAIVSSPEATTGRLKVTLQDLQRDAIIESLTITNNQTNEHWVKRYIRPLRPEIEVARK